jgi:hypothetical protein
MRPLRLLAVVLAGVLATSVAIADEDIPLQNWDAPPFWSSRITTENRQVRASAARATVGQPSSAREPLVSSPSTPMPFVAVTPCRVADTRPGSGFTGEYGSPALDAQVARSFVIGGQCGIPDSAQAVSFLFTAVNITGDGSLRAFPFGASLPTVGGAVLNWVSATPGAVTDAAVVPVGGTPGALTVYLNAPLGTSIDLVLDVNGYYAPEGIVNSLNTLSGDVTLAPGTNVTITPAGNTLTIDAPLTVGPKGDPGPPGADGAPGAPGPKGDTGPSGINSPLVFGPYNSGSPDSGICGNDWANDTFTRTYIVTPRTDGSFDVTELFNGTFVTVAGNSPNNCSVSIPDGITGLMYGNEAFTIPVGADFNFTATCPAGCTGPEFTTAFFNTTFPLSYAWQFHYTTASNGSWNNTDHGNTGNIIP